MKLELNSITFKITFTGGPKKNIEEGEWGRPFESTNPKGDPCKKLISYKVDHELGLCILMNLEVESNGKKDISNVTRYLRDGECIMQMGPKLSKKDGESMVQAERIFKKV